MACLNADYVRTLASVVRLRPRLTAQPIHDRTEAEQLVPKLSISCFLLYRSYLQSVKALRLWLRDQFFSNPMQCIDSTLEKIQLLAGNDFSEFQEILKAWKIF